MQNDDGETVDLYIPRKCSWTNKLIKAKDHASVQINIGHLGEDGVYNGQFSTFALAGNVRAMGDADSAMDLLWKKKSAIQKQENSKLQLDDSQLDKPRVIICGAGVIGAAVSYYLAKMGLPAILVERTGLACGASGKAAGFLALDWCDGSATEALTRRSYELHRHLANEFGAERIGYRTVKTISGSLLPNTQDCKKQQAGALPSWLDGNITNVQELADEDTTAQVHPQRLTEAFLEAAQRSGACLKIGVVDGLRVIDGHIKGVSIDGKVEQADAVVLAMGPWTGQAAHWLQGVPSIHGRLGHSVVVKPSTALSAHCLYLTNYNKSGHGEEVDVFVREDEVYICGQNRMENPTVDPAATSPDEASIAYLEAAGGELSSRIADGILTKKQACYRPLSVDGDPVVGPLPGTKGVYLATGHTCWGILNAPATGEAIAELIVHGQSRVDLHQLRPDRPSLWR